MQKRQVIETLRGLGKDSCLGRIGAEALKEIMASSLFRVDLHEGNAMANRQSLLGLYTMRQRRLLEQQIVKPGFEETIHALAVSNSTRVKLMTVFLDSKTISLLFDLDGNVVGCHFDDGAAGRSK